MYLSGFNFLIVQQFVLIIFKTFLFTKDASKFIIVNKSQSYNLQGVTQHDFIKITEDTFVLKI